MSEEDDEETLASKWPLLLTTGGVIAFVIGMAIIFLGALIDKGGLASAGIVIFIGPFPIVFGAGPNSGLLILMGIILTVTSLVIWAILKRKIG
jgi:uncharacterized membrane protein